MKSEEEGLAERFESYRNAHKEAQVAGAPMYSLWVNDKESKIEIAHTYRKNGDFARCLGCDWIGSNFVHDFLQCNEETRNQFEDYGGAMGLGTLYLNLSKNSGRIVIERRTPPIEIETGGKVLYLLDEDGPATKGYRGIQEWLEIKAENPKRDNPDDCDSCIAKRMIQLKEAGRFSRVHYIGNLGRGSHAMEECVI